MAEKPSLELDPEDRKLVVLARSTRARTQAPVGASVRDRDGRTYAAADVALPSLQIGALDLAVAMAVSSGRPVWRRRRWSSTGPCPTSGRCATSPVKAWRCSWPIRAAP